jgi:replicative DNA helicase
VFTFRGVSEVNVATGWADVDFVSSGLPDLDDLSGGLRPGSVWLVTGLPGVGRSSWVTQIAARTAATGWPVNVLSCLDDEPAVIRRAVAGLGRVAQHRLRTGALDANEAAKRADVLRRLADAGLRVARARRSVTIGCIESWLAETTVRLLVIDDVDLLASDHVEDVVGALACWSRTRSASVLVTLPRHLIPEQSTAARSRLSRLVELAIELQRPDQDAGTTERLGEIDLRVLWHRSGPTATLTAAFEGFYARIVAMPPPVAAGIAADSQ